MFLLCAVASECAAYAVMTHMRYANQRMAAQYFDFTKTGNVLYALYAVVILWCIIHIFFQKEPLQNSIRWLAGMSVASLVALSVAMLLGLSNDWLFGSIGVIKLFNLGLATTLVEHKHLSTARTATEHFIIIFIFLFVGTVIFGIITPTDVPSSEQADAAVILGAAVWSRNRPSPVLRMRINKALDLLNSKIVSTIVCTGSNPYGERTEADVERSEIIKMGVDSSKIIMEKKSSSTIEQVLFMRDSLQQHGFHSFIVVSDHFHLQRALEMCRFNNLHALGAASESSLEWKSITWYRIRDAAALLEYWMFGT